MLPEMRADAVSAAAMPGEVLSPSQASTFLSCQARWYFRYMAGLPDPPAGGAVRGKAVHKLIEYASEPRLERNSRTVKSFKKLVEA